METGRGKGKSGDMGASRYGPARSTNSEKPVEDPVTVQVGLQDPLPALSGRVRYGGRRLAAALESGTELPALQIGDGTTGRQVADRDGRVVRTTAGWPAERAARSTDWHEICC